MLQDLARSLMGKQDKRSRGFLKSKAAKGVSKSDSAPHRFVLKDIPHNPSFIAAALEDATIQFDAFGDALASEGKVGRVDVRFSIAVKSGDSSLRDEYDFMKRNPELFPECHCEPNEGEEFLYMKLLGEHRSLHDLVFHNDYTGELAQAASRNLWDKMRPYHSKQGKTGADLTWHLEERITKRVPEGFDRLASIGQTLDGLDSERLGKATIHLNGEVARPYEELLPLASRLVGNYESLCSVLCHGDLHPSNVMVKEDADVMFIDPVPKFSPGDYLWDIARFVMWLDLYGYIAIELRNGGTSEMEVEINGNSSELHVSTHTTRQDLRGSLRDIAMVYAGDMAISTGDSSWQVRLDFLIASAYLSLLSKPLGERHLLLCFTHGVHSLERFCRKASSDVEQTASSLIEASPPEPLTAQP